MEVVKEYEYLKNGNKICIRRKYKIKGVRDLKRDELDEYIKNNSDQIQNSKNLKDILANYNSSHENKISYSMLYQKYKTVFGPRKIKNPDNEESIKNPDTINNEYLTSL